MLIEQMNACPTEAQSIAMFEDKLQKEIFVFVKDCLDTLREAI